MLTATNFPADAPWQVVYTWSRHEKNVAQHLAARQLEHFLPIYRAARNWNGRRANVELPIFPSYIFVRVARNDRLQVLQVPGVVHLVTFSGNAAELPNAEIQAMRTAVQLRASHPHPYVAAGTRVCITAGPLCGLTGYITRHKAGTRVVVSVDSILRSFAIELDSGDLECFEQHFATAALVPIAA